MVANTAAAKRVRVVRDASAPSAGYSTRVPTNVPVHRNGSV